MLKKFLKTICDRSLINKGDSIVVGVSGGPDSICLLHLLWRIRDKLDLKLYAVHLNHQFRGKEADEDANYVKEFCDNLGIESYIFSINVGEYSKQRGITFEEAGREIRYRLFDEIAEKVNANKIAIAQNRNDQAETVLIRLFRGSGLEGLTAIDYIRDGKIIRPLLDMDRDEIEEYCLKYDLKPRIDKTNLQAIYTRNKIRLELIPYIEKNFNPNIIDTLWRSANILRDDSDYLNEVTEETFNKITKETRNKISVDLKKFSGLHVALKRRIVRKAIEKIKGSLKDINLVHINNVIDLSGENKVGSKLDLPGYIRVKMGYNSIDIIIDKGNNKIIRDFKYDIEIGEHVYIEELGATIKTCIIPKTKINSFKRDNYTIFIDANKVSGNLIVRNRRNGDKFYPLGMKGKKKLKDFFIDEKVPKEMRDKVPIVCDESNIIWVVGYRISELHKVDSATDNVIKLSYVEGCIEN